MTSSLSKRLRMRRNHLSLRTSRSISIRQRYQALPYCHGSTRALSDGTTGVNPRSSASYWVSLPSYARSMMTRQRFGGEASWRSSCRPAGASPAWPGVGAKVRALRAPAATILGFVVHPPRSSDGLGAVYLRAPVPSGCTFTMVLSRLTASMRLRTGC